MLFSVAWTQAGTMRNGVCWARPTLAHRTTANVAGFWHTPTVVQRSRSAEAWEKRQKARHATGRKTIPPGSLEEQVLMSGDIPCWDWHISPVNPRNETTRLMFPTPGATGLSNGSGNCRAINKLHAQGQITEAERRSMRSGNGGKLNPQFVEWLMGVPIGWTDLKVLATPKSRSAPPSHGKHCTNESGEVT